MPTEENSPKRTRPTGRERPGREALPGKTPEREQPKPVKVTKRSPKSPRRPPDSREIPQKKREENLFRRYWLSLKRRNARSELIWIGKKQMICWQPDLGDYGLVSYDPAKPDATPWDATLLDSNRWAGLRNCRLAWLGGDNLLAWEPGKADYRLYRLTRDRPERSRGRKVPGAKRKPAPSLPLQMIATGQFTSPARKLTYLGRGRVLTWNESTDSYRILQWKNGRFNDITTKPRLSDFLPQEILDENDGHLYFTWGGRNHVIAWNSRTKWMLPLGFTNNLCTLTGASSSFRRGLEKAGCDYGGQVLPLTYQSSRRLLLWDENLEGFVVDRVRAPEWEHDYALSHDLEDYLETSPIVAGAISWFAAGREIDSTEWDLYGLEHLHTTLCNFYLGFIQQEDLPFTYRKQDNNKVGPDLLAMDISVPVLHPIDAEELYIAQVALNLWAEISGQFDWHLADYTPEELYPLLSAGALFAEHPWNDQEGYCINGSVFGDATPTDPAKTFRQMKALGMIRGTPLESVFEIARWFRNHLSHGPGIYAGTTALDAYGFRGYPPLTQMMIRRVNPQQPDARPCFFAWSGCHSAAGLMVGLARCLNIPARSWDTWENGGEHGTHHGIDFPTLRLFSKHLDDFYAESYLQDPGIEPGEVFEPEEKYSLEKDTYTRAPQQGENRPASWQTNTVRKGLNHPTLRYLSGFFQAVPGSLGYSTFVDIVRNNRLSVEEAEELISEYWPTLQAAADAFTASTGLSGPEAATALFNQWQEWTDKR